MPHWTLLVAGAVASAGVACGSTVASGEPVAEPPAPQPGASCLGNDGALTRLGDRTLLECRDNTWNEDVDVYPSSDRWVSSGPDLKVFGQGRRNPEFLAGRWTGTPLDDESACSATQVVVVRAGVLGAPQAVTGEPGQPLEISVSDKLFNATLSGFCLWERR